MPRPQSRMTAMAGWLFADLFLVLLIAGLAAIPATTGAAKSVKKPPPIGGSPTPTPTPTVTHALGLDPRLIDFTIDLSPATFRDGGEDQLLNDVNAKLSQLDPGQRMVGFVLVFATDDLADVNRATQTATQAFRLLSQRSRLFSVAQGLGYWGGQGDDFEFKIFLLD